MALVAEDVINEARDFNINFSPEYHTDTVLLRALARAEARFYDVIAEIAPDALAEDHVFDATEIAAGITGTPLALPAFRQILPTAIMAGDDGFYAVSISEDEQSAGHITPQIRLVGRTLLIAQPTAFQDELPASLKSKHQEYSPFVDMTGLRVSYIPTVTAPAALDANLTAPDDSLHYLIGDLIRFMVLRDPTVAGGRPDILMEADRLQTMVVSFYQTRSAGESRWYVSRVG